MSTALPMLDSITERVVDMYSQYPYPFFGTHRDMFAQLVYPFIQKLGNVGSILEAGCGTGNVAIAMAKLLPDVRIVGVDLTEKSLHIARESAEKLGVKNVEFKQVNLLNYDSDLGTFDFVHCQGVLHHLSQPEKGLENVFRYLKPGGHAYIWLYMLLGRYWIREIQEMLDLLGGGEMPYDEKIEWTHKLLALHYAKKHGAQGQGKKPKKKPREIPVETHKTSLKKGHRFFLRMEHALHILNTSGGKTLVQKSIQKLFKTTTQPAPTTSITEATPPKTPEEDELLTQGMKAGFVDQFLHPHAIFYRMPEVLEFFTNAGFTDIRISDGMSQSIEQVFEGQFPEISRAVAQLPIEKQYHFMELVEDPWGVGFFVHKPQ